MFERTLSGGSVDSGGVSGLLRMQFLMNASHFMTVPLLALYMSNTLHFSAARLATVMSANLLAAQALPVFAGLVADRFGSKHLLSAGLWLRAFGLLGFATLDQPDAWVLLALMTGSGVACYEAGLYGIFGRQPEETLADVFASNNQMLNLGAVVGPVLGGLAGLFDARIAFAISATLFAALACGSVKMGRSVPVHGHVRPVMQNLIATCTDRGFLRLLIASLPWFFLFPQLYVTFPLYASRLVGAHAAPSLYVVNGVVGFAFMVTARSWLVRRNPVRMMNLAYAAAAVAFASVAFVPSAVYFFLFVAVYTVIETILLPAIETMTARLAHDGSQSTFFGALGAASALGGAAGYYAGSWLTIHGTAPAIWLTLGGVGAIGFAAVAILLRKEKSAEETA
jgi:predicted MFS family arabinose efflux permease